MGPNRPHKVVIRNKRHINAKQQLTLKFCHKKGVI